MSALKKLSEARKKFRERKVEKTGWNEFSKYKYFELADFLVPSEEIFYDLGLIGVVSFGVELATMTITDLEDEASHVVVTSPMSTASLKACHEVQNLGAVETYIRRYLWVAAMEIVEHDAIDSSEGATPKQSPAKKLAPDLEIIEGVKRGDAKGAAEYLAGLSQKELDKIWSKLPPEIIDSLTAVWPEQP